MELAGSQVIAADRATVWAALNDPETLRACIPGCQELTGTAADGFEAIVKQKIGPVSATFKGAVTLTDIVAGTSYRIVGEGKGGAHVTLADTEGGTELTYEVTAQVGGKIAQLGGRIIGGVARKLADEFFDRFKTRVEGGDDATA